TLNSQINDPDDPNYLDPSSEDYQARLDEINQQISSLESENNSLNITRSSLELLKEEQTVDNISQMMDNINEQNGGDVKQTYLQLAQLKDARDRIESGKSQLASGKKQIEDARKTIADAKKQLSDGRIAYENGLKEYEDNLYDYNIEIEKAKVEINKAYQDLENLPPAGWMILDRNSHFSTYMFKNTINQMAAIGYSLPFLFFLVAALVCLTTMTRLIDEERTQLGIYSAIGYSRSKIAGKYVLYAGIASILGAVPGIFFGNALFPSVIYYAWRLMYDLPPMDLVFPIRNVLVSILSFTALIVAVTYFVCMRELSKEPASLMRPKAPKNGRQVFLEKISFLWKRLSFTSKITARNLIRYKSRFFMTVIGVAGATGLLIVGFGIKDSISNLLTYQFSDIFNYNNTVYLNKDRNIDLLMDIILDDLDNKEAAPFMTYSSKIYLGDEDKVINVEVFDSRKIKDVIDLRVRTSKQELNLSDKGVIITEKFAKDNDLKTGDLISIESSNGLIHNVKIDGICENYVNHYIFISSNLYEDTFDETFHPNAIAVNSADYDKLNASLANREDVESIVNFDATVENFTHMIDTLNYIIIVIILAAGSLAFVVLLNLSEVNISERKREIATLKVLGFHNSEVVSYVFKEIFLLTIIGALFGIPLGTLEHHFIMGIINMEMVMYGVEVNLISYVISFFITIVFSIVVLLIMRKSLNNIEMVESLKSVE
ncbi:MAG: FtsX-like permease family protein, partial [Erysipelotrichaceae bacterium]|nr:FtsX-like permease family protein [Erysipelotrichaceae bacterium]